MLGHVQHFWATKFPLVTFIESWRFSELRKGIENIVYFTQTKHKVDLDPQMIIEWLEWAIVYFKWKTETSVMNAVHTFLYKSEFVIPTQFEVGGNYKWSIMRTLL